MDLVKFEFKGKICICSGKYFYNIVLVVFIIVNYGEVEVKVWLEGVKVNLVCKL